MTAAVNLLRRLRAAEIDVTADADRLRLRSRTPLPPDLIELVRKHKPDLLALLAGDDPPNGDDLVLEASAPPPADVLDLLSRHKAGIMMLLRPGRDSWSAEDWRVFFDERAGITEFDGGLSRTQAEARAFACCVAEWLNHNLVASPPGRCLGCAGDDYAHDPLLPFGIESTGHAWLHSRCWPAWYAGRKAQAVAALAEMGIIRLQ